MVGEAAIRGLHLPGRVFNAARDWLDESKASSF